MSLFLFSFLLMAPAPGQDGGGSMVNTLIMFGAIFAIFYFIVRVTKRKKQPKVKRVKRKTDNNDTV